MGKLFFVLATRIPLVAFLALLTVHSARAIVGGVVDSNSATSPYAGVGSLTYSAKGTYSAVLIAPQYALTAAHVAQGASSAGSLTFNLNAGRDLSFSVPIQQVFVHPEYKSAALSATGIPQNDLAILKLAYPVPPGTPIYRMHAGPVDPGEHIRFVGYGGAGTAATGSTIPPRPDIKRRGESSVDLVLPAGAKDGRAGVFVFHSGLTGDEKGWGAGLAGGDSGSPMFVQGPDGSLELAGINTFRFTLSPSSPGSFTAGGGGMILGPYADWIGSVMAQSDERRSPGHGLLLSLLGSGLVAIVGVWLGRHRKNQRRRQ